MAETHLIDDTSRAFEGESTTAHYHSSVPCGGNVWAAGSDGCVEGATYKDQWTFSGRVAVLLLRWKGWVVKPPVRGTVVQ